MVVFYRSSEKRIYVTIENGNWNKKKGIQVTVKKKMVEMYAGSQQLCKGKPENIQKSSTWEATDYRK